MVINFEHLGARPNFASKDFQINIFQKISMLRKYFWIFVKTKKVLEKILACNGVLKIQICSGKIFKSREKQIWRKIKYEISTDLPSSRARHFESDERDLSPALTYHYSARPGEVDEDELSTLRHIFFDRLLLDRGGHRPLRLGFW